MFCSPRTCACKRDVCMYECMHVCVHVCVYRYIHVFMMFICLSVCMSYVTVCFLINVHLYVYMYTHAYACPRKRTQDSTIYVLNPKFRLVPIRMTPSQQPRRSLAHPCAAQRRRPAELRYTHGWISASAAPAARWPGRRGRLRRLG